jgi:hypothetical protein
MKELGAAYLTGSEFSRLDGKEKEHALEHRALVYLMTQKTDAVLAALAKTIEEERSKLGVAKIIPFSENLSNLKDSEKPKRENGTLPVHERIMHLAEEGASISSISRKLVLPENEVSMVLRLNAMG